MDYTVKIAQNDVPGITLLSIFVAKKSYSHIFNLEIDLSILKITLNHQNNIINRFESYEKEVYTCYLVKNTFLLTSP